MVRDWAVELLELDWGRCGWSIAREMEVAMAAMLKRIYIKCMEARQCQRITLRRVKRGARR